jgi:hypothetical protein|tara:strand:- start:781 stop:984 length:204 start_codon:yes stop_codon:yes gene_type:complete
MSQRAPTTLPMASPVYDFNNEELTRDVLVKAIQLLEREVFLLKRMQESIPSKSIKRHQFLLMGMKHD